MLKIGFGNKQMESREFVRRMEAYGKKIGLFGKDTGLVCAHWKLPNNGYPENFKDYKTYGRHWWTKKG